MDFDFTEEQRLFREAIANFAATEIKPLVEEAEENETFPIQIIPKMGKLGYLGVNYSTEYGGSESGKIMECILAEEIGRVSNGIASGVYTHICLGMGPIAFFGTPKQKRGYLVPGIKGDKISAFAVSEPNTGSDVKNIQTSAKKNGNAYIINGSKTFITNGTICDFACVAAYTDKSKGRSGINLFIVDKESRGFSVGKKLKKAGNRSSDTAELIFEDVRVSEENLLMDEAGNKASFKDIMKNLTGGRVVIAAKGLGLARAAMEAALQYSQERIVFGKPVNKFQYNSFRLAEMATQLEATKLMVYQAAWLYDNGRPFIKEASMAKKFAHDTAISLASEAIELHGGYGVIREYPVHRYLMDAKVGEIGEGTPEIQKLIIAKQMNI